VNSISISVDVPNLEDAIQFYAKAFGFSKSSEPVPGVVVLHAGNAEICLLEKHAGSQASSSTSEKRHYERH
jgi:predicted enzyme related to lactoylglutathione lyase